MSEQLKVQLQQQARRMEGTGLGRLFMSALGRINALEIDLYHSDRAFKKHYQIYIGDREIIGLQKEAMEEAECIISEYRAALEKVISDSNIGVVPKSHLNHIQSILDKWGSDDEPR